MTFRPDRSSGSRVRSTGACARSCPTSPRSSSTPPRGAEHRRAPAVGRPSYSRAVAFEEVGDPAETRGEREFDYDRTVAISDGVFAIALTLLILNVEPPTTHGGFW